MNKSLLVIACCFLTATFSFAQNLVPNPSFEDHTSCPNSSSQMYIAVPWVQPSGHQGTSDYFHACCTSPIPLNSPPVGVPQNLLGNQAARTGDAYGGFFSIDGPTDGNYREYVQAPLTAPLVVGERYCVRFYVSLSDLSTNSTDGIGAYFSTTPVTGPAALPLPFTAQVSDSSVITNSTGWHEVYGEFIATQAFSYITIGNFAVQGQTTIGGGAPIDPNQNPPQLPMPGAYYFVDDVEVYPAATCPIPCNIEFTDSSTVADCNMSNGEAAVSVTGGSGNYTYLWTASGATTQTLPGVAYGMYEVTVDDGPGCSRSHNVFVGQNSTLDVTFSPGFLQCASTADGEVDIDVTGGSAPYTFVWSTGDTTEDLDSVAGGVYSVVVTDAAGCMLTDSTELTSIFGSESTVIETNESCAGANNGSLYVQPGGTFPFPPTAYLWSNGGTTAGIYNLPPGTYTVDVTDFFGCVTTLTGTVASGTGSFSVSISQNGNTLYATTAPNYQWYWNDAPVSGATNQNYTITGSGYFYVVSSGGGNCLDTSNIIETAFHSGITENDLLENVSVYPNPANDILNVVMNLSSAEATEVKLLDLSGRVIWAYQGREKSLEAKCSIPVSSFAEGIYFVQARAGAEQQYIKVMLKK